MSFLIYYNAFLIYIKSKKAFQLCRGGCPPTTPYDPNALRDWFEVWVGLRFGVGLGLGWFGLVGQKDISL